MCAPDDAPSTGVWGAQALLMAGRAATLGYRYGDPKGPMPPPPPAALSDAVQAEDDAGKGPVAVAMRSSDQPEEGPARVLGEGLEDRAEVVGSQGPDGADNEEGGSLEGGSALLGSDMMRVRAGSSSAGSS